MVPVLLDGHFYTELYCLRPACGSFDRKIEVITKLSSLVLPYPFRVAGVTRITRITAPMPALYRLYRIFFCLAYEPGMKKQTALARAVYVGM